MQNVTEANISLFSDTNLRLEGNGTLSVSFHCPLCLDQSSRTDFYMRSLHLSGISSLSRNYEGMGKAENLTIGSLRVRDESSSGAHMSGHGHEQGIWGVFLGAVILLFCVL